MLTPTELKQFQIKHYSDRLLEAKTIAEKAFLRKQLFDHKKTTPNARHTNYSIYPMADGKICRQVIRHIPIGLGL